MYVPEPFRQDRPDILHGFMRAFPFATLVSFSGGKSQVTHLPLHLDTSVGCGALRGHMARGNPHWKDVDGGEALAIFLGPHAYVSPQWYPSKQDGGKVVPTWNYAAVHVHGRLRVVQDRAWLLENVTALTADQEAAFAEPWKVSDAPADYVEKMLGAIVGVELEIATISGKWKLSQNKPEGDRLGAREGLSARGGPSADVAEMMADRA